MTKTTRNGLPALKESVSYKGVEASLTMGYVSEEARDNATTVPTKEELIRAIDQLPSMQEMEINHKQPA